MKRFGILAAGLCAAFVLTACGTTESQNTKTTSAGAVGTKSSCCSSDAAKACAATCDPKNCPKGEACCKAAAAKGSMGAVGEKTECTKTCPATGATAKDPSMGTVGDEKPAGCCSKKAS